MKTALFERFSIDMTEGQALSCSRPGMNAEDDVEALRHLPEIVAQLDAIDPQAIAHELAEYGAWDDEELEDKVANQRRILWIAAGNIREEDQE